MEIRKNARHFTVVKQIFSNRASSRKYTTIHSKIKEITMITVFCDVAPCYLGDISKERVAR
jgi:hypothetical protein